MTDVSGAIHRKQFDPSTLGATAWWRADRTDKITFGVGSKIAIVQSLINPSQILGQAVAIDQPTLSTGTFNGHDCFSFDGLTQFMTDNTTFAALTNPFTMLIAVRPATWVLNATICVTADAGETVDFYQSPGSPNVRMYQGGAGIEGTPVPLTLGQCHVVGCRYDNGGSSTIQVDRGAAVAEGGLGPGTMSSVSVGRDGSNPINWWAGDIAELIFLPGRLSDVDMQTAMVGLLGYYSL